MARRKFHQIEDDLDGTVEKQALDFFEREKAAYEERTGERVEYVPAMPATRTPIPPIPTMVEEIENLADYPEEVTAKGEGEN